MTKEPRTTEIKDAAFKALEERKASKVYQIDNSRLPAGSPMYYYCRYCGQQSDCLPEEFTGAPRRICSKCLDMKETGWLE